MLNKAFTDVLQEINGMTNSVILKYPNTIAVSEAQDMQILIPTSTLDGDTFPDIGIKDTLGDLLNLLKLFPEDREITIDENTINISCDNTTSTFIVNNIALMDAYNKTTDQFTKMENMPSVAEFNLSTADIKKIKSGTSVFKDLSEVIFTSKDSDMTVSLGATNKFNAKSNTFSVIKQAITTKQFTIKIPVENFKMLPVSDYTVHVKYNSARDSYRIFMCSNSLEGLQIILSVKV